MKGGRDSSAALAAPRVPAAAPTLLKKRLSAARQASPCSKSEASSLALLFCQAPILCQLAGYVLLKLFRVFVTVKAPLGCTVILIQYAGVCGGWPPPLPPAAAGAPWPAPAAGAPAGAD